MGTRHELVGIGMGRGAINLRIARGRLHGLHSGVYAVGHTAQTGVNEAEIRRLWDLLSLDDLLTRHPRRPGAAAIRAVLATPSAGITRSELEGRFLDFLDRAGLPRPEKNVHLHLPAGWFEADCVWHEQRLIAELDGHATHATRAPTRATGPAIARSSRPAGASYG